MLLKEPEVFSFGGRQICLQIPDRTNVPKNHTAYWSKLWPSAIALCRFMATNPSVITSKKVLELAAGLGLPGMVAAHFASEVVISDYIPEAIGLMQSTAVLNDLTNVTFRQLDWYNLPADLSADVLLLSDINYDPAAFKTLYKLLMNFLNAGKTIILSTPQRLMAKPFIEQLLPYCMQQEELEISLNGEDTFISVFVLHK